MKRFRFPKGVREVNVPFLLHDFSPWQEQIAVEMQEMKGRLGTNKRARFGYVIEDGNARIVIRKYI